MGDVTELDNHRPHEFWEAMCVKCLDRWIAVVPVGVLLKKVECKKCGGATSSIPGKMCPNRRV